MTTAIIGTGGLGSVIARQPTGEVVGGWLPAGGALGDGVWNRVGRSVRVLEQPVTGAPVLFYVTDNDR